MIHLSADHLIYLSVAVVALLVIGSVVLDAGRDELAMRRAERDRETRWLRRHRGGS